MGVVGVFEAADEPGAAGVDVGDGAAGGGDAGLVFADGLFVGAAEGNGEVGAPVRAEDVVGEEAGDAVQEVLLADPEAFRVVGGQVAGGWLAGVAGEAAAGFAEHPPSAQLAEQVGPQRVVTAGVGVSEVGSRGAAGPFAGTGDGLGCQKRFPGDEGFVAGLS